MVPPVQRKAGLSTTVWILMVVLGVLVLVGVVLWMMADSQPDYGPRQSQTQTRLVPAPTTSLFPEVATLNRSFGTSHQ